jgi:dTDP-4-amino-4,6-dideoxygalactose transaminase
MTIPFLDLKAQYSSIRDEIHEALKHVLDSTAFAGGPAVAKFEKEFASFCGCRFAVGVGSGTEALWLTLLALGIGSGDEVITAPNSFIATAEAISFTGARPVFVDVDEKTYTMNPDLLESAITNNTKAIIPVHLFGQSSDMDPILAIAREESLYVVEDAAQAHGAQYKGRPAGSLGAAGCFSFYPGKNLGAYGEAGAVVTNDASLAEKIQVLRDHGQKQKHQHMHIGWNARMDGFQGAILSVKLKYLPKWNDARRRCAQQYNESLQDVSVVTPMEAEYGKHVYHIYAIRARNRDDLQNALTQKNIHCGIHYPIPIHLQSAYAFLGHEKGSFPVAEKCAQELLSLPMYAELSLEQIQAVAAAIAEFEHKLVKRTK